jgi:hypothetical protein
LVHCFIGHYISLFLSNSIFLLFKDDCINSLGAEFIISSRLRISFSSLRVRSFEYYLSGDINDLLNVELTCNDQVFFEILKMKIRSISISHSITKTREEKFLTLKLEKRYS